MKKITFLLMSLSFLSIIYGGNKYYKFAGKDALWNNFTTGSMSWPSEWQTKYILGDTVEFNGLKYLEVFKEANWNRVSLGGLREDTLTRKIYYCDNFEEVVLYDFSLNVGDTIFYNKESVNPQSVYYKVVDSIGTIELNGELRRKWYLTTSMHKLKDIWIEGIGSVTRYGLMNPLQPDIPTDASRTYFGCFKYMDLLYFNREATNSEVCPCSGWLVNVPEITSESDDIKLYPLPTKDKLNINLVNTTYDYLEIYTCNSKLIEKIKINSRENLEINLQNFENGIYFMKFSGKDNMIVKKIVKL